MFLFWIFRTKHVARTPCCLLNIGFHARPLVLLFIFLQVFLLIVVVLHLRGVVDLLSPWDLRISAPIPGKYKNYLIISEDEVFKMRDSDAKYFRKSGSNSCLIAGTKSWGMTKCNCRQNWFGDDCGIPAIIWHNSKKFKLKKRDKPRRLLYAFAVNQSIDFVEIRIQELRNVIDVFIILERNNSDQDRTLLSQLSNGWFSDNADHILYISQPVKELSDIDVLTDQIVHHLSDVRPDDLIIFTSPDELPTDSILICLKLYDGFPEIFSMYFHQVLHGFYNPLKPIHNFPNVSFSPSASTIHFFLRDCKGSGLCLLNKQNTAVIGSPQYPAGWKCNECNGVVKYQTTSNFTKVTDLFAPNTVLARGQRYRYLIQPRRKLPKSTQRQNTTRMIKTS